MRPVFCASRHCFSATLRISQRGPLGPLGVHRRDYTALLAQGLGDAICALPGAGKDKQGHIMVPVPDAKLDLLAVLERTKPVPATVEVLEVDKASMDELASVIGEVLASAPEPAELSGKFLSSLRAADAIVLAVPCREGADDPVKWLQAAERAFISADLQALEQQVCKQGAGGPNAELDVVKLRKALSSSKDAAVRRDADDLLKDILAPGLMSLRARLRAGVPAREARPGLEGTAPRPEQFQPLDSRFEDLARAWLNVLVSWRPLLVLADVPEADAGSSTALAAGPSGNQVAEAFASHVERHGIPCLTACVALESESAGLKDEPEFLQEYLESFGLRATAASEGAADSATLRQWNSQTGKIVSFIPKLLNQLTYYTAGEKEARAWMCHRIRKDHSPLPFALLASGKATPAPAAKAAKATKGGSASASLDDGVPAFLASKAIHTSFENRVKNVLLWKFEDLEALSPSDAGPGGKERAKADGKMKKVSAQHLLEDGDVVEFDLS
ncbi:unnamed protein product [Polarella glacialis]|uniref:Obg-like ATPase 1 n=1 Tax=Polarella glacialis TaxID=89957 RepID=A0A813KBG9_POLGL|nr:unnamed protein product [Polarella glacialis]